MFCYIHIPFCTSRCSYCRFATFTNFDDIKIAFYIDFLCQSIKDRFLKDTTFERPLLKSIYFGGGTPSLLTFYHIKKILDTLKQCVIFSDEIEITLETTPQNISCQNLLAWHNLGINRISTGIQSLNEKALKEIGRITTQEIREKIDILVNSPIQNISLDFIIGLPHTKPGELSSNISHILETYPAIKHISVYMLEDYTYPKNWQEYAFPKEAFEEEYTNVQNTLERYKFCRYELSNFSMVGFECKHNQAYWNHSQIVAFGLGSYGFEAGKRYSYADNFKDYYLGKGYTEDIIDKEAERIEKIMFGLRTNGVQEGLLGDDVKQKLYYYLSEKYLVKNKNMIGISKKGIPVMDTILADII